MSATEARVHFGEVMRRVSETKEAVIVERAGRPQVAIVPMDEFQRFQAMKTKNDAEKALSDLSAIGEKIRQRRETIDFPEPEEVIRQMREERSAEQLAYLR
jgi:prevent-host-death family protein